MDLKKNSEIVLVFSLYFPLSLYPSTRTVMKSGPEIVKAGLRQFFESAADDIEKMVENLKLGKVSSRNQVRDSRPPFYSFAPLVLCTQISALLLL